MLSCITTENNYFLYRKANTRGAFKGSHCGAPSVSLIPTHRVKPEISSSTQALWTEYANVDTPDQQFSVIRLIICLLSCRMITIIQQSRNIHWRCWSAFQEGLRFQAGFSHKSPWGQRRGGWMDGGMGGRKAGSRWNCRHFRYAMTVKCKHVHR